MQDAVDRIMAAFTRTHQSMTAQQARTVRLEITSVVEDMRLGCAPHAPTMDVPCDQRLDGEEPGANVT